MATTAQFEIDYIQYLDPAGQAIHNTLPPLAQDAAQLTRLYRAMVSTRVFDAKSVILQRTGKLGTYPSCLGHEATQIGIASAMQDDDVLASSYRESGAQLWRGVTPREIYRYWGGDERGSDYQQGPARHDFPIAVPIATQCLHAAGAALAFKIRGEARAAVCCVGDGGSSKGDFYGAINIAGARELPLVTVIINNQWAISVPRHLQTGAKTLAQKGIAAGLPSVQVDGNDVIAVHEVMREALERARAGGGGSVIEAVTYRLSDHTTVDDARRYRQEAEVKAAWQRDPIPRLRCWLEQLGAWDETREIAWQSECERWIDEEIQAYLETKPAPPSTMFDYTFAELPPDLQQQRLALAGQED